MSGFNTHQRRVHDESLPALVRHTDLRSCLVRFAPYGFRATYHHVCLSARIPKDPEREPSSLVRAVQELRHARELRLADERDYANRRRPEKARGMRQAESSGSWRDTLSGRGHVTYCPQRRRPAPCYGATFYRCTRKRQGPGEDGGMSDRPKNPMVNARARHRGCGVAC